MRKINFEMNLKVLFLIIIIFLVTMNFNFPIVFVKSNKNSFFNKNIEQNSVDEEFGLVHLSTYETNDAVLGTCIENDFAYIANRDEGLLILDISNPKRPKFVAEEQFSSSSRFGIEVKDDCCFIAGFKDRLPIFNVSDPYSPVLVNSLYDSSYKAKDFVLKDDLIYIVDFEDVLNIYNISDPTSPEHLGTYRGPHDGYDIVIREDLAYIATSIGLLTLNIEDPNYPYYVDWEGISGEVRGVTVLNDLFYIAAGTEGLHIYRYITNNQLEYVNSYDTQGYTTRVGLKNDCAFLCDGTGGLLIVNVTNPNNLELISSFSEFDDATNICFKDNYAFLANGENGLEIFFIESETAKYGFSKISLIGMFFSSLIILVVYKKKKGIQKIYEK